jgi:hypothetical protein
MYLANNKEILPAGSNKIPNDHFRKSLLLNINLTVSIKKGIMQRYGNIITIRAIVCDSSCGNKLRTSRIPAEKNNIIEIIKIDE